MRKPSNLVRKMECAFGRDQVHAESWNISIWLNVTSCEEIIYLIISKYYNIVSLADFGYPV